MNPCISPANQVKNTFQNPSAGTNPKLNKEPTPIKALKIDPGIVAKKRNTSRFFILASGSTSPVLFLSIQRLMRVLPVFPIAIRIAVGRWGLFQRLAANAPIKIPGIALRPNRARAANATPSGGQMGETWVFKNAKKNPSCAAKT